jgi:DNA-binding transcriptional LysR family regulator
MKLEHLKSFLAVRKHLGYTRAGKALFLSQPAVSRHVQKLEDELGVPLFEQIGKTLALTDAGRTLASEAERLLGDLERVSEEVKAHAGPDRGTLRLGASTTPGFYLLPPLLGLFHRRFPAVEISYTVDNSLRIADALLRNEIDLGFVGAQVPHADLRLESVIEDEVVFFTSLTHHLAGRRVSLRSLGQETWVVREKGSATRQLVEERIAREGMKIDQAISLGCPEGVKAVVAGGVGISFLSIHGLREDFKRGRLRQVKVRGFKLKRPIYRVSHVGKHASPVVEAFLRLVRDRF